MNTLRTLLLTIAICSLTFACANTSGGGGGGADPDAGTATDTGGGGDDSGGTTKTDAGTTTPTDSGTTTKPDAGPTGDWTIEKLQKAVDEKACATAPKGFHNGPKKVTLSGLVVSTPPLLKIAKTLDAVYVKTKGGGLWNGLYVVGAAGADIAKLEPGQVISVTGDVQDYYCQTQLKATLVNASKATELPVSTTVTLDQLGVHAKPEDNEATESVLVSMDNLVVSDPEPKSSKGTKFCGFWVGKDADDKALLVVCTWGTTFATYDKDAKTWNTTVKKGDKVKSLRGVVQYSFEEYKLAPLGDDGIDWE